MSGPLGALISPGRPGRCWPPGPCGGDRGRRLSRACGSARPGRSRRRRTSRRRVLAGGSRSPASAPRRSSPWSTVGRAVHLAGQAPQPRRGLHAGHPAEGPQVIMLMAASGASCRTSRPTAARSGSRHVSRWRSHVAAWDPPTGAWPRLASLPLARFGVTGVRDGNRRPDATWYRNRIRTGATYADCRSAAKEVIRDKPISVDITACWRWTPETEDMRTRMHSG